MEQVSPGIVIGPMGVGQVIDAGIGLARAHFRRLMLIAAWGLVPAAALTAALSLAGGVGRPDQLGGAVVAASIIAGIGAYLAEAALMVAVARIVESAASPSELAPGPLYRWAAARLVSTVLLSLVAALAAIPLLILFPLGIYVFVRWSMAWAAVIVERRGPIASLRRSWQLTRGAWWHTFGVLLVGTVVAFVLAAVVGGVLGGIAGGIGAASGSLPVSGALQQVASVLTNLVFLPFFMAYTMVLYYELRARNEGFDLVQRARQTAHHNQI